MELAYSAPPDWAQVAAQVILNGELAVFVLGVALPLLPFWKPPWQFELGFAARAIAGSLIALELALSFIFLSPPLALLLFAAVLTYLAYWLPESHRLLVVEAEALIAAPREAVFALATDPLRSPSVLPQTTVEAETSGPLGIGSRYRGRVRLSLVRLQATDEIVEYDPPHRFADRTLSGAPYNQTRLTFEPVPQGTRIQYEHVAVLSVANAITGGGLLRGQTRKQILKARQDWFQALRLRLETPR